MAAVIFGAVLAMQQRQLVAFAPDIIEPDDTFTLSKVRVGLDRHGRATVQGSAQHSSVFDVPVVITHGSPLLVSENLHSARAPVRAVDKSQWQ